MVPHFSVSESVNAGVKLGRWGIAGQSGLCLSWQRQPAPAVKEQASLNPLAACPTVIWICLKTPLKANKRFHMTQITPFK